MRISIAAASIAAILAISAPASAATIVGDTTIDGLTLDFGPAPGTLDLVHGIGVDQTAQTVFGETNAGAQYSFASGSALQLLTFDAGGVAVASGPFSSLTFAAVTPGTGFDEIEFNLGVPNLKGNFSGDFSVNLLGGGVVNFNDVLLGKNQNKFSLSGLSMSSITFSGLVDESNGNAPLNFDDIRQVNLSSVVSAVPEPATWAMMILGFGMVGSMIRSANAQRRRLATVAI